MDKNIDFEKIHKLYFEQLKKENPDNSPCIICFDKTNVNQKTNLCEDCTEIQRYLSNLEKSS